MKFKLKIIFYFLKILTRKRFGSRVELLDWQKDKLQKYFKAVLPKSPYYAHLEHHNNLNSFPIISKSEFMENFNEINTVKIDKNEAMDLAIASEKSRNFTSEINGITVGLSTGTSGKRGIFLVSEDERSKWVALVMHRVIQPKFFKKQKIAFFLRANSNLYTSVESNLFEFKYFDIFKPIDSLLTELAEFNPSILASQPSVLIELCDAQLKDKINLQLTQIISYAEVLHDSDKEVIESTFNSKITEVYQCTEGFLGVSCKFGTMHLNEDCIHIEPEWIDDEYFYPIITDFSRESQPVIRYKLNDILKIKNDKCACGSQFMAVEKIIGRDDDVMIFKDFKIFPDVLARKIALETDAFLKYEITQFQENKVLINLDCENAQLNDLKKIFLNVFRDIQLENKSETEIEFEFEHKTITPNGNKLRKIKRTYEN